MSAIRHYICVKTTTSMDVAGLIRGTVRDGMDSPYYMLCDGRLLRKDEYPELYKAIGYVYTRTEESRFKKWLRKWLGLPLTGLHPGEFRIPDLRRRTFQDLEDLP